MTRSQVVVGYMQYYSIPVVVYVQLSSMESCLPSVNVFPLTFWGHICPSLNSSDLVSAVISEHGTCINEFTEVSV